MEKQWITAQASRGDRTTWTVAGSVLLHVAIIGVAAWWPVQAAVPAKEFPPTTIFVDAPPGDQELPTPESNPAPAAVPSDPPPLVTDATAIDAPPALEDPTLEITPPPKPAVKTVDHPARLSHPTAPGTSTRTVSTMATASGPAGGTGGHPGAMGHWHTPQPPYPYAMRAARVTGNGSVRVTTDGVGRVTSASVTQSTGSAFLDENTVQFARMNWSGPPNASANVPITYQMR